MTEPASIPTAPLQSSRSKYPGMRPREAQVFRLWLQQHESEYDRFDYNVRIGPGMDPGPEYGDATRKSAVQSSQKRLDAVGWKGTQPTLIEVKDFALELAIAQLTQYAAVWQRFYPAGPAPALLIICSASQQGFDRAAQAAGVQVNYLLPH